HGNRKLHLDQLLMGLLFSFYDPLVRSLRRIEDRGSFGGRLDLSRLARSTTSGALGSFDPAVLVPLIAELRHRLPGMNLAERDPDLAALVKRIIAADGSYFTTLCDSLWALHHHNRSGKRQGQIRANVQLDVATFTPVALSISGDDGHGEPPAFIPDLQEDVLYVMARTLVDFSLIRRVLGHNSDLVLRIRANAPAVQVLKELPLSQQDREAGIVSDQVVQLSGKDAPAGTFRRVVVQSTDRDGKPQTLRLLSNLTDQE